MQIKFYCRKFIPNIIGSIKPFKQTIDVMLKILLLKVLISKLVESKILFLEAVPAIWASTMKFSSIWTMSQAEAIE